VAGTSSVSANPRRVSSSAQHLKIGVGETTDDGSFTLETTSCLGVCGVAPAMMIDDELYGNLTRERIIEIIDRVGREDETR
jgi:NADH-quinone oxidoreductase subunit E